MKYLKRTTWDISATFHHISVPLLHNLSKTTPHRPKNVAKKTRAGGAPMAPEHLGSMVLLQSWPLLLAQRAHAPGKIHNFQRSEVCWGGCSLKKQCGLKLGLENVVLFFWFVFVAMLGYLFCWLSYFISDDCDKWCLMMVAFILTWKTAESNRMKQPDHFCLPSKPSATTARNFAVEAPFVPFSC